MILPAAAQESTVPVSADEEKPDDIVVTGIRANLESAQNRKRNADTVVDSITAEDIGSFPDKSVAEALQRVPGIPVISFADRKSVGEGKSVSVRVDLGGRGNIKKNIALKTNTSTEK